MLKDFLADNAISIYSLSRASGIPYSTLNDLANGKVDVDRCKVGLLRALAGALMVSLDEAYDLCKDKTRRIRNSYGYDVTIRINNKQYVAEFVYNGSNVYLDLCRITRDTSFYIDEIAAWRSEAYIRNERMASFR